MKILLVTLCLFTFSFSSFCGDFDPILADNLQRTIEEQVETSNIPGISAAVYIPGQGYWLGASGRSSPNEFLTTGMKFCIGSQTKTFISVLILKLAESNILNLDDSLHKWIPSFQHVNPNITVRQLLNHTSGLYDFINDNYRTNGAFNSDTGRFWNPKELLVNFMKAPYFEPGQAHYYSNTNYIIAAMIIKAAAGTNVSEQMRQLIIQPSNLSNTFYPVEEFVPDTIAYAWPAWGNINRTYPATSWYSGIAGAGNMFSTPENMVLFYQKLFGGEILNQQSLNEMLSFVNPGGIGYGLGLERGELFGRVGWGHRGMYCGYISFTAIDSASGFIFSIAVNTERRNINILTPGGAIWLTILNHFSPDLTTGYNKSNFVAEQFRLYQNYPNPFNPSTKISFDIPKSGFVKLIIFDLLGREVTTLVNQYLNSGGYEADWNASNYSSGVYYYSLVSGDFKQTKKMMLVK